MHSMKKTLSQVYFSMKTILLHEDLWKVVRSYSFPCKISTKTYVNYRDLKKAILSKNYSLVLNSPHFDVNISNIEDVILSERIDIIDKYLPKILSRLTLYHGEQKCSGCSIFVMARIKNCSAKVCAHLLKNYCTCSHREPHMIQNYLELFSIMIGYGEWGMIRELEEISSFSFNDLITYMCTGLDKISACDDLVDLVLWLHTFIKTKWSKANIDKFYEACLRLVCRLQNRNLAEWLCSTLPVTSSSVRHYNLGKLETPSDVYILDLLHKNKIAYRIDHRGTVDLDKLIENDQKDAVIWFMERFFRTHFSDHPNKMIMNRHTETVKYLSEVTHNISMDINFDNINTFSQEEIYRLYTDSSKKISGHRCVSDFAVQMLEQQTDVSLCGEYAPNYMGDQEIQYVITSDDELLAMVLREAWNRGDIPCVREVLMKFRDVMELFSVLSLIMINARHNIRFLLVMYRMAYHKFRCSNDPEVHRYMKFYFQGFGWDKFEKFKVLCRYGATM